MKGMWWGGAVAHYWCRALGEEVVVRRCSALWVQRLGERMRWWGGAVAHYWC